MQYALTRIHNFMTIPILDGITEQMITTARITTRVLCCGAADGIPVIFVHGNLSSATWWEDAMVTLPQSYRAIAYDQRGYGGADPSKKTDATRGMCDLADDLAALMDTLSIDKAHLVASSMGGSVLWQFMMDYPLRCITVTQVAPGSPYGFGGTHGNDGIPNFDDFAGSGGGLINPQFAAQIKAGDRSDALPVSPRNYLKRLWDAANEPKRIEEILSSTLSTHIGEQDYPGDFVPSPNYPGFAPGIWGVNNALSPKYLKHPSALYAINPKPPVLWIRGDKDVSVADGSLGDYATLGKMGLIPNYPGEDVVPPQPMVSQTHAVLEQYQANGGWYREIVLEGAGHVPYLDKLPKFNQHLHLFLKQHS
jgi:pimeloyl-ACP methyl ester carboxylesterase